MFNRFVRFSGVLIAVAVVALLAAEPALAAGQAPMKPGFLGWVEHYMAPIMFSALVAMLLLGYPVAFTLAACGLLFAVFGIEMGLFQPNFLQALPERVYGTMNSDVLLAIPFFTFMGIILERSGMAEDLLDTIGQLFGTVRGGVAYAVIFVGALLAATTGVVAASVISMGLISLPIMLRYGYDRRIASGAIIASGTLAQIIPPSLVLIVMADQLGRSVGDMYQGAMLPGLILTLLYAVFIFVVSIIRPSALPGLPPEAVGFREPNGSRGVFQLGLLTLFSSGVSYHVMSQANVPNIADFIVLMLCILVVVAFLCAIMNHFLGPRFMAVNAALTIALGLAWWYLDDGQNVLLSVISEAFFFGSLYGFLASVLEKTTGFRLISRIAEQVTFVMAPPLALIFLVLGTIFIGVATPTEGGAMGAVGALALAAFKRFAMGEKQRFNLSIVQQGLETTLKLSAFVLFILIGARVFALTFYGVQGHLWVEGLLTSLPGGQMGFLFVVNLVIFILGFFLDFFELAFVIIPLVGPVAEKLGIDLIWFGVIISVNMQTSFLTPPFGFALFYLRSVAAKVPYIDKVTGKRMEPVTTGQIYLGAVPFVLIQCLMIVIVVAFPQLVMHYKGKDVKIDPALVEQQLKNLSFPGLGSPGGTPGGLPGLPGLQGLPSGPSGLPGLDAPKQ